MDPIAEFFYYLALFAIILIAGYYWGWHACKEKYEIKSSKITVSFCPSYGRGDIINIKGTKFKIIKVHHDNPATTTLTVREI